MSPASNHLVGEVSLTNPKRSVAGSETTSVALRLTLCALLTTPSAYRKVQDEVDAFYAENTGDVITYAQVKTLTYLQAVIRETMRLWPPSSGLFSKQVPNSGDTVHGYYLPPGTEIAQSMTGIGRTCELFGADSDIFRPERWLEASPQQFEEMASTVDLVFSTAKYNCLGKHIALMELGKILVEVCRLPFLGVHICLLLMFCGRFSDATMLPRSTTLPL